MKRGIEVLTVAATTLASSIVFGTLIGETLGNVVYDAYPMVD